MVTFNRRELLEQCIQCIQAQRGVEADLRIVVVDNSTTDSTFAAVTARFPEVTVIRPGENTGPAGGFARGMDFCYEYGCDWFWLFGDDTRAEPSLLAEIFDRVRHMDGPALGIIKPASCAAPGGAMKIAWHHRPIRESIDSSAFVLPSDVFSFGGCLVPRRVVDRIGVPDASLFMMMEEMDYCLKAREAGFDNYVFPTDSFHADAAGTTPGTAPWRGYYQSRNHLLMIRRRKKPMEFFWFFQRQLKFILGTVVKPRNWKARIYYRVLGVVDGLRGRTGRTVDPLTFGPFPE